MENTKPSIQNNNNNELSNVDDPSIPQKPIKPPKLEDKPFQEFIRNQ